jgi:L-lactate dehydrogenase complex protein LldE
VRVALFITCVNDALFPQAGRATVALLERLGCTVDFPREQTCCGQIHGNSGYAHLAEPLLRRFERAFDGHDAIVCPSGSCTAFVHHRLPHLAGRVWELSTFVTDRLGVEDVGASYPHRVTYHPACHATRALGVGDRPLRLLRRVRGIDLVELPQAEQCCGFGGTFAVKNAETSAAMLADKLAAVQQTGAEVCTALDSSCLMHIGGGLSRLRTGTRAVHLAEVLAATA